MIALLTVAMAAEIVAVLPFDANSVREELVPLGAATSDMLVTDLARSPEIVVVERSRINEVMAELELQRSGFTDPSTAARLGKGLGATHVIVGSLNASSVGLRLDARVVDVEDQQIEGAASATGTEEEFFRLESEVAAQLYTHFGIELVVSDAGKPVTLDAALEGGSRIRQSDEAYLKELKGIAVYRRRRLYRVDFNGGYAIRNGSGLGVDASTLAEAGIVDPAAVRKQQSQRRKVGLGTVGAGLAHGVAAAGFFYAGQRDGGKDVNEGLAVANLTLGSLALLVGTPLAVAPLDTQTVQPQEVLPPEHVDAALERYNRALALELGVSERRQLEIDAERVD